MTDIVERWTRKDPMKGFAAPPWVLRHMVRCADKSCSAGADIRQLPDWPRNGDTLALHRDGSVTVERATTDRAKEASECQE